MEGFQEVVAQAWERQAPNVDACRLLDIKFRRTARALQSWSMTKVGSVRSQLYMSREIIAQLDKAQEGRTLTEEEIAWRRELKGRCLGLASLARTIARHRSRIRYLEEGDANTKFFHLQACHRKRKSYIPAFQLNGTWVSAEVEKEEIVFNYFKGILGTPFQRLHSLQFNELLPTVNLSGIDACFSEEEIWAAVTDLPSDRAPGPDGFSGIFYKMTWGTIKQDIINAFNALWSLDGRSFHHLNGALMILLQKKQQPTLVTDYRPISLIHSFSKLFTKCLARRLAPKLDSIVSSNQTAFIKGRSIHDNFRAVQLACRWLYAKKVDAVLLKVDIAKAFDSVAWPFLLEALQHIGFPRRWIDWISLLLSTSSTKVVLNGRPGNRITHARGLRQGDPISPMLFVIVMESLNSLFKEADRRGVLSPLHGRTISSRTSMYADDVVLLVAPTREDFQSIQQILQLFAGASGLITNVNKCVVSPIHCTSDQLAEV